jgi:bla regulator protein blaR1
VTDAIAVGLIADHLWQSTLFGAGVALLSLAFRGNRAAVRYWLWLTASIKFAVPFAALVAIGSSIGWTRAPLPDPAVRLAIDIATQPFSPLPTSVPAIRQSDSQTVTNPWLNPAWERNALRAFTIVWAAGSVLLLVRWGVRWWRLRQLVRTAVPMRDGREIAILRRQSPELPLVIVDSTIEPGVVGILRPLLLWPGTISNRLDDQQIAAIFAHELAHVRRRDNLTAAMHMAIEAVFWFHPLVWWLSARLVDERERACDEAVLRSGSEPQRYAESILRTCEFYLEAPLPCVAGVTGANLKNRIETIMRHPPTETLGYARSLLLVVFCCAAIVVPISVGIMRSPRLLAQSSTGPNIGAQFEAVSIKRNTSGAQGGISRVQGDHYTATNITLRQLILNAYGLLQSQLIGESPLISADFTAAEHFDIEASVGADFEPSRFPEMLRAMLADRFKLVSHTETRDMPVYALVNVRTDGRLGPQLKVVVDPACPQGAYAGAAGRGRSPAPGGPLPPAGGGTPGGRGAIVGESQGPGCGTLQFGPGQFIAKAVKLDLLVRSLANRAPLTGIDRVVIDRTGLSATYDFELKWTPPGRAGGPAPAADDPDRPSLFTALQEQLGLKLEPQRAPIQVLVVDSIAMPTEN